MTKRLRVRRLLPMLVAFATGALVAGGVAYADNPLTDIGGNSHAADIDAIFNAGISLGCTPTTYCPADSVKRDQMASFLARTAGLSGATTNHFPVANARGQIQTYCTLVDRYPGSFDPTQCQGTDAQPSGIDDDGLYADVAIGADELPIISEFDNTTKNLVVKHCRNLACTLADNTVILDATGDVGRYTSIAVGVDGKPVISYYDKTNGDLKVVHCDDVACKVAVTPTIVDQAGDVGQFSSIALGAGGGPIISYFDATSTGHLKVAVCADVACTNVPTITTADAADGVGLSSSIALGSDDVPVVAYYDLTNTRVKVMRCGDNSCGSPASVGITSGGNQGQYVSMAIGVDGFPVVSYRTNSDTLSVAHCTAVNCSSQVATPLDIAVDTGSFSSIAIGTNGLPAISYFDDGSGVLRLARCSNTACSSAVVVNLATVGASNSNSAIAIGIDGEPVVAYYETTSKKLGVARPAMQS